MPDVMVATRLEPLAGRQFANDGVMLAPAPAATRISLRVRGKAGAALRKALGFDLPSKPKTSTSEGEVTALWIGPDEWMVLAPEGSSLAADLSKTDSASVSAVDVSHRNTAILVSGKKAALAIGCGCPQDLSLAAFPVGATSRTVLAKAEIILFRTAENEFRVECWRSFSDYAWKFLADAARSV